MSLLTDKEKENLTIKRMIFHVVGKSLEEPILLKEIHPPQHTDFFLERVKSALHGNLFEFRPKSNAERILRSITEDEGSFTEQTQELATDFQRLHSGTTSVGVFFVFELGTSEEGSIYALIKYDNEDVVRYVINDADGPQVPRLERFRESFVRKAEAMQKIALVRLDDGQGGKVVVRDRSKPTHISDYFERFLQVHRIHSPADMSGKLVEAFKETYKKHRSLLPLDVQKSGVNRIYEVLHQGGHQFVPEDCEPLITAIFGQVDEDSPLRRTLMQKLKEQGIAEEAFDIQPEYIPKPKRRRLETVEGTQIIYDIDNEPEQRQRSDGRIEVVIVTTKVIKDDVDIEKNPRGY